MPGAGIIAAQQAAQTSGGGGDLPWYITGLLIVLLLSGAIIFAGIAYMIVLDAYHSHVEWRQAQAERRKALTCREQFEEIKGRR